MLMLAPPEQPPPERQWPQRVYLRELLGARQEPQQKQKGSVHHQQTDASATCGPAISQPKHNKNNN
jgi:hypothetical protein